MRYVALVNPIAGNGEAPTWWRGIADRLVAAGVEVDSHRTDSAAHTVELARSASRDGATVIAVGGDGMVRDVAAGVVPVGGTMAVAPAGRGNDLAVRLGLPHDGAALAAMLINPHVRHIDVLDVNGEIVPGNVYVGVDSVAARIINEHRSLPAALLYRAAGLAAVWRWQRTEFTIDYTDPDGRPITCVERAHDIVIANSGRYGHGLEIVPTAEPDDGLIDVLVVQHGSRRRVVSFLLAARTGAHVRRSDVEVFRATRLSIAADREVPFGADGDEITELPAEVAIRPGALSLVTQAGPDRAGRE